MAPVRIPRARGAALLFVFFFAFSLAWPQGGLGININLAERGGSFVDLVKEEYRWSRNGQALMRSQVDSAGWPLVDAEFLYDARPVAEWAGQIDDPDAYRVDLSGTYLGALQGRATVASGGEGTVRNVVYDSASNTTTFEFAVPGPPGPGHGFFHLRFTNTRRLPGAATGSGFTRFRLHRPGYPLNTPKIFTDAFLRALTGVNFSAIRFMNFTSANNGDPAHPGVIEWPARKLPGDASQAPIPVIGKKEGAAWEYVAALANLSRKDAWINVPLSASAGYVRGLATLLRDSLDPSLDVYVESGNEVWNGIFEQRAYNLAQANARGIGEHQNHARRTVELAHLFREVFGPSSLNARVRVVLCSHQPMLKWWVDPMIQYIQQSHGTPSTFLYGISSQAYFSVPVAAGQSVAQILAAGRTGILGQITDTSVNLAGRTQWISRARALNLPGGYLVYEGGPHPTTLGETVNVANRIRAERDSGMGELMKLNYGEAFLDLGGTLAMQFTLSSGYNRYGCWGLTDDIGKPDRNYKYGALKSLVGGPAAIARPRPRRPVELRPILRLDARGVLRVLGPGAPESGADATGRRLPALPASH